MRVVARYGPVMTLAILGVGGWQAAQAEEPTRYFEIYGFAMVDWIQDS